ncbi:MAG: hypothetical protein JW749_07250 [Sedimentisphaerales bacterium]|nr:hypothetical protein [Sedimentisphaerales bacterium]
MPERNTITKRQQAVLDDLFVERYDENRVLDKHNVSRRLFEKWLSNETFTDEFERRLNAARRQTDLILARCAGFAAVKLVELTDSTNPETARKACLDIITLLRPGSRQPDSTPDDPANHPAELPPDVASRLLSALALGNQSRATSDK